MTRRHPPSRRALRARRRASAAAAWPRCTRARDLRLGRRVAVKILRPDLARDPTLPGPVPPRGAERGRRSTTPTSSPSTTPARTCSPSEDGTGSIVPYIVMEYVDGMTLRQLLLSGRRLLPERALEITAGVLAALDYSHRHGIVHRDIKPANVMLTRGGDVKVMDFGIARALADSGQTMTQAVRRARHRALPLARAGARRGRRQPQRHLLHRLPALRAAHRAPAVHRRLAGVDRLPARERAAGAAVAARPRGDRRRSTRSCSRRWRRAPTTATRPPPRCAPTSSARSPACRSPRPCRRAARSRHRGDGAGRRDRRRRAEAKQESEPAQPVVLGAAHPRRARRRHRDAARRARPSSATPAVREGRRRPTSPGSPSPRRRPRSRRQGLVLGTQTPQTSDDRAQGHDHQPEPAERRPSSRQGHAGRRHGLDRQGPVHRAHARRAQHRRTTRAQRAASTPGCTLGTVDAGRLRPARGLRRRRRAPAAGATVDAGTPVDISVSNGKAKVPDVVGESEAQAKSDLINAGLRRQRHHAGGPTRSSPGTVLAQSPKAGTSAVKGTPGHHHRGQGPAADPDAHPDPDPDAVTPHPATVSP